jgi:UDPglucose 6-dehydrogenase
MQVGFIGLGKLGLPVATAMAKHYDLIGYDVRSIDSSDISITYSIEQAVTQRDIVFIAVPTPHDPAYDGSKPTHNLANKDFDYGDVIAVLKAINPYVNKKQLIVLISTVLPGTVRSTLADYIPNAELIYNPYLIAMGTVADDFAAPEMIMIGNETGVKDAYVLQLEQFYKPLLANKPRIITGTWEEMECTKIFYNTFISAKLSLVNMIQDVSERIGHVDTDIVTDALAKSTKRIMGPAYMKAGMGDGGPCHPRDNIALRWLADDLGLGYDLFDAIMTAREQQAKNLADKLCEQRLPIVIMGQSFKPGVPYTDGSYSMLVGYFCEQQKKAVAYDTVIDKPAVYLLAHDIDHNEIIEQLTDGSVVIDPWRNRYTRSGLTVINYGLTR